MILYHGTNQLFKDIDFNKSRLRTDFGKGFYLSDKLGNARDWAVDKSGITEKPTVMRYELSDALFIDENISRLPHYSIPISVSTLAAGRDNSQSRAVGDLPSIKANRQAGQSVCVTTSARVFRDSYI